MSALYDCNACGACCAFTAEWPELRTDEDRGPDGPPPGWVEDGHVRWAGGRCSALQGEIGACTRCVIYARRPSPCRGCEPGSQSCHVARRKHGLPVMEAASGLEGLLDGGGERGRIRR